jgi:hypothetical protein
LCPAKIGGCASALSPRAIGSAAISSNTRHPLQRRMRRNCALAKGCGDHSGAYSFAPSDPKRAALNTRGYAAIFFWLSHPGLGSPKMQPTCCAVFAGFAVFARWAGIVAHMVGASQRLWCPVGEREMRPGVGVGRHTGQGHPMNSSTTQITADTSGTRMRSPCRSACRGRLCVVMSLGRCRLSCRV